MALTYVSVKASLTYSLPHIFFRSPTANGDKGSDSISVALLSSTETVDNNDVTVDGGFGSDTILVELNGEDAVTNNVVNVFGGSGIPFSGEDDFISIKLISSTETVGQNTVTADGGGGNDVISVELAAAEGSDVEDNIIDLFGDDGNDDILVSLQGIDTTDVVNNTVTIEGGRGEDTLELDIGGVLTGVDANEVNLRYNARNELGDIIDTPAVTAGILEFQFNSSEFNGDSDGDGMLDTPLVIGASATTATEFFGYDPTSGEVWYDRNGNSFGGQQTVATLVNAPATLEDSQFTFFV